MAKTDEERMFATMSLAEQERIIAYWEHKRRLARFSDLGSGLIRVGEFLTAIFLVTSVVLNNHVEGWDFTKDPLEHWVAMGIALLLFRRHKGD